MGIERGRNLRLLQYGYHTEYHDTVCNINPFEWWVSLSNSYFSKARISSMETPVVETEIHALSGTLSCSLSCVNMDLGPELFPYMVPLDCLVMTLLRLRLLLLVRQKRARSYWKLILGKETQPGPVGPCWGVPSACCLWPCNTASAASLLLWYLHRFVLAAAASYQTIDHHPVKNRLALSDGRGRAETEGVGVYTQASSCFLHKQFVNRDNLTSWHWVNGRWFWWKVFIFCSSRSLN